jgi:hypothetical protein
MEAPNPSESNDTIFGTSTVDFRYSIVYGRSFSSCFCDDPLSIFFGRMLQFGLGRIDIPGTMVAVQADHRRLNH